MGDQAEPRFAIDQVQADGANLPLASQLVVPPGVRQLELHFTILGRQSDQSPEYRYRLEGGNEDWVKLATSMVQFTNLSPGSYRFEVQDRRASKDWSRPVSLSLEIQPVWFQRTSVRILRFGLLLVALWMGVRYRNRRIDARSEELEARVKERTEELEWTCPRP